MGRSPPLHIMLMIFILTWYIIQKHITVPTIQSLLMCMPYIHALYTYIIVFLLQAYSCFCYYFHNVLLFLYIITTSASTWLSSILWKNSWTYVFPIDCMIMVIFKIPTEGWWRRSRGGSDNKKWIHIKMGWHVERPGICGNQRVWRGTLCHRTFPAYHRLNVWKHANI